MADMFEASHSISEYYSVPHIAVPKFFGRKKLVAQLQDILLKPRAQYDKPNAVVLQALGGQGKSQIALELCSRLKMHCRGVFWLDATLKATLERGFEEIAKQLNQPVIRHLDDTASKIKFVLDTIETWKERWLMVYDNYDRPDEFPDIKRFLPGSESIYTIDIYTLNFSGGQGGIIFTSRHAGTIVLGQRVLVPSMMNDGGIELLLRDMPDEEKKLNRIQGEDIVRRLGGLALAIEQAAAYISYNRMALPDFVDDYERKKRKVLKHIREDLWEYQKLRDRSGEIESLSAFTTWEMSLEQVEWRGGTRDDYITRFLSVVAFLEPSHIGSYLFEIYLTETDSPFPWLDMFRRTEHLLDGETGSNTDTDTETDSDTNAIQAPSTRKCKPMCWSTNKFWLTIERLCRLSLVQSIDRNPSVWFSIHPVISDWLQLRQRKREAREEILREAIGLMSVVVKSSFSVVTPESRRQELLAHLDSCQIGSRHINPTQSLGCAEMRKETNLFGKFYSDQGKYDQSEALYKALLKEDRNSLDRGDSKLLQSMTNLAIIYRNQGRSKEAEELHLQVMESRKRVYGVDHPNTLASINSLASTYMDQGRLKEAEKLHLQVTESRKRVYGEDHPDTLTSMNNLAMTYMDQGRLKEAEELHLQVMESRKRVYREDHPNTLTSMNNLALTYMDQGRLKEAEALHLQVIESTKRVLGEDHPGTLTSMNNLASTYCNQGRLKEAEALHLQVIQLEKRVLREDHPDTLTSMNNLASTYWNQGRLKEAEELYLQVMESRKRVCGEDHPGTLTSINDLASTYWNQGRVKEAEELLLQVMESRKRVCGEDHPDTLTSMNNLAMTYMDQGKLKEAEALHLQVMESRKRVCGEDHPDTLTGMNNLAMTYMDQGKLKEAEALHLQVMESRKRVLGEDHPNTLTSMNNLAMTYMDQGKLKEAEELYLQVMQLRKRVLREDHPNTLNSMNNLASTYCN
jgi:tetratricopeptide (TPR) repeat protein